jgi:hypothetical protein
MTIKSDDLDPDEGWVRSHKMTAASFVSIAVERGVTAVKNINIRPHSGVSHKWRYADDEWWTVRQANLNSV